jgi:hypothetical protein
MIVAIHQPHFIPWLGYLHRMSQADLFIVLDHVQFERRNYQNRSQIRIDGEARWLSVPVLQRSQKERIVDKEIDNSDTARPWGRNHFATLRHAYREAGYFSTYAPQLRKIFETPWTRLVDLDAAMLEFLRHAFSIRTRLVRSSELNVEGAKGELILNLCRQVNADALLAGGLAVQHGAGKSCGPDGRARDAGRERRGGMTYFPNDFTLCIYPMRP